MSLVPVPEQLRKAREDLKLSIHDAAEATKIRSDHLRALESGDYEVFAAPVYIRGFTRSYAAFLKLDPAPLLQILERDLAATKKFKEPPPLTKQGRSLWAPLLYRLSKVPWPWLAGFAAVLLLGAAGLLGYRLWDHYQSRDPLAGLGPETIATPRANGGETLPVPQAPSN